MEATAIQPQPKQEDFLSTTADIAFFGGSAGGGKTYALLMEPLYHILQVDRFGAVFFRRTTPQLTGEGGAWDETYGLYPHLGGRARTTPRHQWHFPPFGNTITFSHMEHEKNRFDWKSAQIPLIIFDQVEDFAREQLFYMLSRNRSMCGVKPYVRAGYNPVPADDPVGGWIHEFVSWYLDDNLEYPDPAKSGVIRWFVNVQDKLHWYDSREAAVEAWPDIPPKSFTFIPSSVYDNKILLSRDPNYLANLFALDNLDMERLLKANHKIRPEAGNIFNRAWFRVIDAAPAAFDGLVRFWDFAATQRKIDSGAATAGVLMGLNTSWSGNVLTGATYTVLDVVEEWVGPADIDDLVLKTAARDGTGVAIRWEEEGGSSGKRVTYSMVSMLAGYDAEGVRPTGDKITRSKPLAAQARVGNVQVLRGAWTERFLNHMHSVPDGATMDVHDAAAGAFGELTFAETSTVESEDEPVAISDY